MSARIAGAGHALPPSLAQADLWADFFEQHYDGSSQARRIFAGSGVRHRHAAVDPRVRDVSTWSTGRRMQDFLALAQPLGDSAIRAALADADTSAEDVGLLVVTTCSGYATPGLDIRLADAVGMSPDAQRLAVGHMGCYAAIPSLGSAADFVVARGRTAVLLCVEVTTLHLQPPSADPEQVVSHALFSDAASALVLRPDAGPGLRVVDMIARTDASTADQMTWDVTDLGFRMGLSRHVPDVLARHVADVVKELLHRNQLDVSRVDGWAVHPGGPRILDVVQSRLGLSDADLEASRQTLAEHGNCSSPTVLLALAALPTPEPGGHVVMMAFGPGLTLYAALLQAPVSW